MQVIYLQSLPLYEPSICDAMASIICIGHTMHSLRLLVVPGQDKQADADQRTAHRTKANAFSVMMAATTRSVPSPVKSEGAFLTIAGVNKVCLVKFAVEHRLTAAELIVLSRCNRGSKQVRLGKSRPVVKCVYKSHC